MNKVYFKKTMSKRSKALYQHNANNQEESSTKSCGNLKGAVSLLMISQREIQGKNPAPTRASEMKSYLIKSNNTTPRSSISIDFAAKQFFQILLMDIKNKHAQLNGELEPVTSAISI